MRVSVPRPGLYVRGTRRQEHFKVSDLFLDVVPLLCLPVVAGRVVEADVKLGTRELDCEASKAEMLLPRPRLCSISANLPVELWELVIGEVVLTNSWPALATSNPASSFDPVETDRYMPANPRRRPAGGSKIESYTRVTRLHTGFTSVLEVGTGSARTITTHVGLADTVNEQVLDLSDQRTQKSSHSRSLM